MKNEKTQMTAMNCSRFLLRGLCKGVWAGVWGALCQSGIASVSYPRKCIRYAGLNVKKEDQKLYGTSEWTISGNKR